jgi:hypothetical protein
MSWAFTTWGALRIERGGGWLNYASITTVAYRDVFSLCMFTSQ